jgi:hypothetical protein
MSKIASGSPRTLNESLTAPFELHKGDAPENALRSPSTGKPYVRVMGWVNPKGEWKTVQRFAGEAGIPRKVAYVTIIFFDKESKKPIGVRGQGIQNISRDKLKDYEVAQ